MQKERQNVIYGFWIALMISVAILCTAAHDAREGLGGFCAESQQTQEIIFVAQEEN